MEQMYSMGVTIHSIGIVVLIAAMVANLLVLDLAKDIEKYKRLRSIVLLPLNSMLVAAAIFTGSIMMAAKHLDFTLENIIMIAVSIFLIMEEVGRSRALKHVSNGNPAEFISYKQLASKVVYVELFLVILISFWMWFFA